VPPTIWTTRPLRRSIQGRKRISLSLRAYAVEGSGEAKPPQDLYVLVALAGFAGKRHQK